MKNTIYNQPRLSIGALLGYKGSRIRSGLDNY